MSLSFSKLHTGVLFRDPGGTGDTSAVKMVN